MGPGWPGRGSGRRDSTEVRHRRSTSGTKRRTSEESMEAAIDITAQRVTSQEVWKDSTGPAGY